MFRQAATLVDNQIERRLDRRGYALEAIVVFLCGAVGAIGFGYVWLEAGDALETQTTMMQYNFLAEVLTPILVILGLWVFYTVGAHVLAGQFNGRGPIIRLFRTTAWAIVPIGIWNLLRSIVVVYLFFDADIPAQPDGLGAEEQLQTILAVGLESPIYVGTLLLGVLFTVWSGYLLSLSVEQSKNISRDGARKIAAVLSGAFALYLVWSALQWGGVL